MLQEIRASLRRLLRTRWKEFSRNLKRNSGSFSRGNPGRPGQGAAHHACAADHVRRIFHGRTRPDGFRADVSRPDGTALVAAGAAALNQLLEREYDAKMRRTQNRPLPAGHLEPATVMIFGGVCATAGLLYLALAVNLLTSVIGAVTLVSYLFIYTPLKRVTWLNTAVGAVPGALPPLMAGRLRAAN